MNVYEEHYRATKFVSKFDLLHLLFIDYSIAFGMLSSQNFLSFIVQWMICCQTYSQFELFVSELSRRRYNNIIVYFVLSKIQQFDELVFLQIINKLSF